VFRVQIMETTNTVVAEQFRFGLEDQVTQTRKNLDSTVRWCKHSDAAVSLSYVRVCDVAQVVVTTPDNVYLEKRSVKKDKSKSTVSSSPGEKKKS
jgi:hypothetical protein